ncbi:diguanylate cyclase [Aurantivibrio plasticivorans]
MRRFPLIRTLLFWIAVLMASNTYSNVQHGQSSVDIKASDKRFFVHQLELLTTENEFSAEEIASDRFKDRWSTYQSGSARSLNSGNAIWFRFDIQSKSIGDASWLLSIFLGSIRDARLSVYSHTDNDWWHSRAMGLNYPLEERYFKTRFLAFPLSLEANQTYTAYLQVQADNIIAVPISISRQDIFEEDSLFELLMLGIFFGALCALLLYNACLYVLLRDKLYFVYCCYISLVAIYQLHVTGLGPMHFWYDITWMNEFGSPVFSSMTFLAATLFFREMLALRSVGGWILHSNTGIAYCWALVVFSSFFTESIWDLINILAFFTTFVGVAVSLYLSFYKHVMVAKIYLLSWSFLIVTTFIFMLALNGALPFNQFTAYSQMGGFLAEMILLSFALAYRINLAKKEQLAAREEALVLTHRVSEERKERLKAQKETLDLQQTLNLELEKQVETRTQELHEALKHLEAANDELTQLSMTDALTQVSNRRYFNEAIEKEFERAYRKNDYVAVVFADIDHFKQFNDRYGHAVGDACLRQVADALRSVANRPADLLARYGGEEFVFLLPGNDAESASVVAERAREAVEQLQFTVEGKLIAVTASFGVSSWRPNKDDQPCTLIESADDALYQAKDQGRNRVVTSKPGPRALEA